MGGKEKRGGQKGGGVKKIGGGERLGRGTHAGSHLVTKIHVFLLLPPSDSGNTNQSIATKAWTPFSS